MAQQRRRFIQISAGSTGLYVLDESGGVWQYRTEPPGQNGKWIPVLDEADGNHANETLHHLTSSPFG